MARVESNADCAGGRSGVCPAFPRHVMPGLVPGIHAPLPPRPLPARTAMPQDVDARNKSGHDDRAKPRPDQNGFTTTNMTIPIISTVGISLTKR